MKGLYCQNKSFKNLPFCINEKLQRDNKHLKSIQNLHYAMTEQKQQKNSKNNLKSFPFPSLMKRTKDLLPSQNNLLQSGKHNQTNKIQKYFYKDLEMDISAASLHFPSVPELHIAQPSISPNPKKFRSGARHFVFFFTRLEYGSIQQSVTPLSHFLPLHRNSSTPIAIHELHILIEKTQK